MSVPESLRQLEGKLVVSCQADEGDAFYGSMDRFARAAVDGGAAGIRANGARDVRAIRQAVSVPVIGIEKVLQADGKVLITPTFEAAEGLVAAGAAAIALDCTRRGQRLGALDRIRRVRNELRVPVLADISTVEEAVEAAAAGADFILSTMRGYTDETAHVLRFEPSFIRELVRVTHLPVIAEGRIETSLQASEAIRAGAFAVVVGTVITRPHVMVRRFADALQQQHTLASRRDYVIAVDMGGTNTKYGIVSDEGESLWQQVTPTPGLSGQRGLLDHLQMVARSALERAEQMGCEAVAIGIATAGWVDPAQGRVVYATDNLPGWTGARIAETLQAVTDLPVLVENDANALAVGEHRFGAGRGLSDFVCITLGTGVGGGCYIGGRLNRGAHFFANAVGHVCIEPNGRHCTCGRQGCLEAYTNTAALLEYAGGVYPDSERLISAANAGTPGAIQAIRTVSQYLARGCALLLQLLDPEALILAGGMVQGNPLLTSALENELSQQAPNGQRRKPKICVSPLGYHAGVLGAAAVAFESLACGTSERG